MSTIIEKAWGTETVIVNGSLYCGKIFHLNEGWQCSLHHHKIKDETFHVLDGIVWMEYGGEAHSIGPGDTVHIPPLTRHRFGGVTNAVILEISSHHDDADTYRHEDSRRRGGK